MSEIALSLRDVHRHFEAGSIRALDGVSVEIRSGESVSIIGQSGSGKSTLLQIMGTLDFASSGQVCVAGQQINGSRSWDSFRNLTIGFVFQAFHLIPYLTLFENVSLALAPQSGSKQIKTEKALSILDRVGLSNRMYLLPTQVSGGERQRAAIARALVTEPKILLADEPTGNLDSKSGGQIFDLLLELISQSGKTLVVATHNSELAQRLSRTIEIRDGKVI